MLTIKYGDVFQEVKPGDCFIHGCNAQGVMGSGIAKIVKERWPEAYNSYRSHYEKYGLRSGTIVFQDIGSILVANAITQEHYGRTNHVYVDYSAVRSTLSVAAVVHDNRSSGGKVVFPFIGGGWANGDRKVLLDIFHEVFDNVDIEAVLVIDKKEEYDACMAMEEARRRL